MALSNSSLPWKGLSTEDYCFLLAASLAACGLTFVQTSLLGPALLPDSLSYLSAAESLAEGSGLNKYGGPYVNKPPLLPVLLSFSKYLGLAYVDFARILQALLSGVLVFITGSLARKLVRSRLLFYLGCAFLVGSPLLSILSVSVMSELLFIIFCCLGSIYLAVFSRTNNGGGLVGAGAFFALACLTRYVGVAGVMAGALYIFSKSENSKKAFRDVAIFGMVATLPLSIWLARNWLNFGTLAGTRYPAETSLAEAIKRAVEVIASWFLPGDPTFLISIIFLAVSGYFFIRTWKRLASKTGNQTVQQLELYLPPFIYFGIAYLLFMFFAASMVTFNRLDHRLLSPVYIPVTLVFLVILDQACEPITAQKRNLVKSSGIYVPVLLLLCLIAGPFKHLYEDFQQRLDQGAGGYSQLRWKEDALHLELVENHLIGKVFSNAPDFYYLTTGDKAERSIRRPRANWPLNNPENSPVTIDQNDLMSFFLRDEYSDEKVYLVWFNKKNHRDYIYAHEKIAELLPMTIIVQNEDGVIYRIQ